jgi:hypothetical protein
MSERLKVTLSGGSEAYLRTQGDARELRRLIVEQRLGTAWLPIEDEDGVVRVDAIVHLTLEGPPDEADRDHERRLLEERRRELEGMPLIDDLHALERRAR